MTAAAALPDEHQARLVRNLLALRAALTLDQMATGRRSPQLEDLDQALADLGRDMKSTAARAADRARRLAMLPRAVSRKRRAARPRSGPAVPRE